MTERYSESGFWTGQNGCAQITARTLRNEDAGAICHAMNDFWDAAKLKPLLLEDEQEDALN
jgi:hypothetical protein